MRKIFILAIMSFCISNVQAQFLKKLKDKVNQSAKDVKDKVKDKAEKTPDRIVDHAATKVDTKAETKITNKENKADRQVDKTVDKVDSIKLKKARTDNTKDTITDTAAVKQIAGIRKKYSSTKFENLTTRLFYETDFLFAVKSRQNIPNVFSNNKKLQA